MLQFKNEKENLKVLIIDDSVVVRREILKNLEETSYQVCGEAGSLSELTSILSQTQVNTLILDIIMPDIYGIELARHLKESYGNKLHVILTSPLHAENYVFDSITSGAFSLLIKPIKKEILIDTLDKLERKINDD